MKSYKEDNGTENTFSSDKDSKGAQAYSIEINKGYKDPLVRCKAIFNCTSYCLEMQHGPETKLLLTLEQWQDNKRVSFDEKTITVVSNIRKRILPKKRPRMDSDDEE